LKTSGYWRINIGCFNNFYFGEDRLDGLPG